MAKSKRAPKPAADIGGAAKQPPRHHAEQTVHPPQQVGKMPVVIISEQRDTSKQILAALTKTAVALSGKEGGSEQVAIMERLWTMQKDAEDRQAAREFGIAKVAVAMELPAIPRTKTREFIDKHGALQSTKYADLDDIEGVLDPICRKFGLTKEYTTETDARGWAAQVLTVRHVSGHKEVYKSPFMPLDTTGSKNNNQGAGSTAKYGRRYGVIGAFNIYHVDEDLDGETVTGPVEDKFADRVKAEAGKKGATAPTAGAPEAQKTAKATLTLPEAADALEAKLLAVPHASRGAILMKHINIIEAMQKDAVLGPKAAELRELCKEPSNAA